MTLVITTNFTIPDPASEYTTISLIVFSYLKKSAFIKEDLRSYKL